MCRGTGIQGQQCTVHWIVVEEGAAMAGKSPRKTNAKKQGKTLKEKQTAKKLDKAKRKEMSHIPPTGH
jgi:hypothetical protein